MYRINKTFNLFAFVGEISNVRQHAWHKERKTYFLKASGGRLNTEEKKASTIVKNVCSKNYPFIEAHFLRYGSAAWGKLSRVISPEQASNLKHAVKIMTPRFDRLWKKEITKIRKLKTILERDSKKLLPAIAAIQKLCNTREEKTGRHIPIYLLAASDRKDDVLGWFSAWDNKYDLVLEYLQCTKKSEEDFLLLILLHEIFHMNVRENKNLINIIRGTADKNKKILAGFYEDLRPQQILEELLISTFVPEGYLAQLLLHKPIDVEKQLQRKHGKISLVSARRFCAFRLKKMAQEYSDRKLPLDKRFLRLLVLEIKRAELWKSTAEIVFSQDVLFSSGRTRKQYLT